MASNRLPSGWMTAASNSLSGGAEMGDNLSETESDTSSLMGDISGDVAMKPPSPASREQLSKRIESLLQENRVLKMELETYKLRVRTLQEENKSLKQASVLIQAKAEQEEEFISNTLLKKIQELKKEKESLALNYEQEEECLTNDLSRKLNQLKAEKAELTTSLQQEQESLVNKLMRRIRKLESETLAKQNNLDQLRREKVTLENTLEQEQEALVNRLWKRMDKLEAEKRCLQGKLDHATSAPPSPMETSSSNGAAELGGGSAAPVAPHAANASADAPPQPVAPGAAEQKASGDAPPSGDGATSSGAKNKPNPGADAQALADHIIQLRQECNRLKQQLKVSKADHAEKTSQYVRDEQETRQENLRLRRKLEMELERRQELCRHLSESESSLEIEDERHFNELSSHGQIPRPPASAAAAAASGPAGGPPPPGSAGAVPSGPAPVGGPVGSSLGPMSRGRTISSPVSYAQTGRPHSPAPAFGGLNVNVNMAASVAAVAYSPPSPLSRCQACGTVLTSTHQILHTAPPPPPSHLPHHHHQHPTQHHYPAVVSRTKSSEGNGEGRRSVGPPSVSQHSTGVGGSAGAQPHPQEKFARPANPPNRQSVSPAPSPSGSGGQPTSEASCAKLERDDDSGGDAMSVGDSLEQEDRKLSE